MPVSRHIEGFLTRVISFMTIEKVRSLDGAFFDKMLKYFT